MFWPFAVEPVTGGNSTGTAEPTTVEPTTQTTSSPVTHTKKTTVSPKSIQTTLAPTPTPKTKKGFDGGSFAGGIALGAGVAIIGYIIYRVYASKKTKGYSTM